MGSSPLLRVYNRRLTPYSDSLSLRFLPCHGISLAAGHNSLAHFTISTRSGIPVVLADFGRSPPTDCKHAVSGLLTPLPGCFSPFPHGTGSLSALDVFSLMPWSARIPAGILVPRCTWERNRARDPDAVYGAFTLYGRSFQTSSTNRTLFDSPPALRRGTKSSHNPPDATPSGLAHTRV